MVDVGKFSELVEHIYDASTDIEKLASLAPKIAQFLDARSAVVQIRPTLQSGASVISITDNFTAKSLVEYQDYYYKVDEWVLRGAKISSGAVFQGSDLIPYSEFEHAECYTDYGRHLGLYDTVAATFPAEFGLGVFGVHRSRKEKRFDPTAKNFVELLLPHLRKSLELRMRLDGARLPGEVALDGLDQLNVGVLVVDGSGRLIFANSKGEAVLRRAHGLTLRHGSVMTSNRRLQDMLMREITQAVLFPTRHSQESGGHLALPAGDATQPLMLKVLPIPAGALPLIGSRPLASIFIGEPDGAASGLKELLGQLYGLTPAEARLVEGLLAGDTLQEYANRAGVRIDTARAHLKHVFAKTGAARQAELISELLRNPVLRMKSG